jgi:hypothetical protein
MCCAAERVRLLTALQILGLSGQQIGNKLERTKCRLKIVFMTNSGMLTAVVKTDARNFRTKGKTHDRASGDVSMPISTVKRRLAEAGTLRILTHNIYGQSADWTNRQQVLANGMRELSPDLIALAVGGILGEGLAQRVCGQALARLSRWEEAEPHLAASVQTLLAGECRLEAARTQVVWGLACRDHSDEASAQAHFEHAAVQFEASGLTRECETAQKYLAHVA